MKKESRKLYKSMGLTLILFLILFGAARDYIFIPLLGKVWGIVLMTTPEGFISNSNVVNAILKSPWIIPIGAALLVVYAFIAMWQVSAVIVGAGYMRCGKRIRLRDLIRISLMQLNHSFRKNNWMLLVYSLIIIPFANVYQTNDVISSFVIPEYIQDFINEKTVLFLLFVILALYITYIALRWFFLLPAFILKKKDFRKAKEESTALTAGCWFGNGLHILFYNLAEFIRLSLVPAVLILLPIAACYYATRGMEFSARLFHIFGISLGLEVVQSITGTLVQISASCFMVELYFAKLREKGMETETVLPELEYENADRLSINALQTIGSIFFSAVIAGVYLATVSIAQTDRDVILEMFGSTEIIAHKGYSSEAPENTMPAFRLADSCACVSYIELDVWSSRDGIPVVIHNSSIKDATGIDKKVYECTAEELKNTPAPYKMNKEQFPDAYIPTLEEVLAEYGNSTPLLIEIKGFKQDPELPAKIVALMKKYGCEYTSLIHSGNYGALEAVKQIDPDIQCGLILAMVTGSYYNLPYADFFSIEHTFVNQNTVSLLHRRGKKIYAWTVNYPESAEELKFSGTDGIITDVPDKISSYVADSNELIEDVLRRDLEDMLNSDAAAEAMDNAIAGFEKGEY